MKKDDHTEKTLSRRNFLKTTGSVAAVTAMTIGRRQYAGKRSKSRSQSAAGRKMFLMRAEK
ncbi:MAG: twin-arginine translocation signal domain-containing protein [Smithella sp.]